MCTIITIQSTIEYKIGWGKKINHSSVSTQKQFKLTNNSVSTQKHITKIQKKVKKSTLKIGWGKK